MIDRYAHPSMQRLWSDDNRYRRWLEIERLVVEAWEALGAIPAGVARRLAGASVSAERVEAYEREYHHDVLAFLSAAGETADPEDAKYLHFGMTSTDLVDTALATLLHEALGMVLNDIDALRQTVRELALAHRHTAIMGRTHGMHAEPTSLGLKLALWWLALGRDRERLVRARAAVGVVKLSGAVGNYANIPPFVESYVATKLGLEASPLASQVLPRDRHAEVLTALAILGSGLDAMATEIRHLQRTEVGELEEPFAVGQRGSSAMPHKRNPVRCEQISGLARVLRGYVVPALEDVVLWHERDISHSSVERVILPDATILADYLLQAMNAVMSGLTVHSDRMRANIQATGGLVFSQKVLLALVEAGMTREAAYKLVQGHAMDFLQQGAPPFSARLSRDPEVAARISAERLAELFRIDPYLTHVDDIFRRIGIEDVTAKPQ